MTSIAQRSGALPYRVAKEMRNLLEAARLDLVELRTQLTALRADAAALRTRLNSCTLSTAGLAIKAGSSPTVKAGTAFSVLAGGTLVTVAASTDMAALVGTLATAKSAAWAFYIDAAGTITASAKTADAATAAAAVALLPAPPSDKAMIGFITVGNATGSDFVGGTTALDAASVTTAYYNTPGLAAYAAALTSSNPAALNLTA